MSNSESPKPPQVSEVRLSACGLANIQRSLYADDFTFLVNRKRYCCPSFIAEFLSPRVSRLRSVDPTFCEFVIDDEDSEDLFLNILSLASGTSLTITEVTYDSVKCICSKLWNRELFDLISPAFEGDLSSANIISRLTFLTEMQQGCESELAFGSSHFWELLTGDNALELNKLNPDLVHQLISRPSLTLMNEDSLWEFITQFRQDSLFPSLLECIKFEYLSIESMTEFVQCVDSMNEVLTPAVWAAIGRRLILPVLPTLPDNRFLASHFPYYEYRPFSGIIAFLTRKHGGNVHDLQVVKVSASSWSGNSVHPLKNIVDLATSAHAWTVSEPNQWMCWDFTKYHIQPTHYSIRSEPYIANLRTWVLEGSPDGSSWVTLDERRNDETLKHRPIAATFEITNPVEVRFLRIFQKGPNHADTHYLALTALEFFGNLKEVDS
jgi:hypothetical protein